MSKLTALQQAMRIVEQHAHNLFNIYNADSRAFLDEMAICFEQEREQILDAYREGRTDEQSSIDKWHNRASTCYYNETYKGGEQ